MFRGDDIILALRHEGTFTEIFELENYPCDQQALTITLNFNTRLTGPWYMRKAWRLYYAKGPPRPRAPALPPRPTPPTPAHPLCFG